MYGKKWEAVAAYMNETESLVGSDRSFKKEQCFKRWMGYLNPELNGKKVGPWSKEEVTTLCMYIIYSTCISIVVYHYG